MATSGIAGEPAAVVALDVATVDEKGLTTLSFVASGPVEAKTSYITDPYRVILDFPEINFQFESGKGAIGAGLIRSFRYGLFAKGRSRLVIDLSQPAEVKTVNLTPARNAGAWLVSVVIGPVGADAFSAAVAATRAAAPAPRPVPPLAAKDRTKRTIVIDPGHGGVDPGAMGKNGLVEKDVVFAFARRLKEKLDDLGDYRVILTRDHDVFVSLGDRVKIARDAGADLFISLHADALPRFDQVRGATIYTASARATDAQAARVAEKENKADVAAGLADDKPAGDEVMDILADLARRETRTLAQNAAAKFVGGLQGTVTLNKNPLRAAGFRVLSAPDVPSLLLELGYLSSPKDTEAFASDGWKEKAANAVTKAIESYFASRLATGAPVR